MKDIGLFLEGFCIGILIILIFYITYVVNVKANTSSPVEEMYHRQLVTTIDSIFDARFGPGCCEDSTITESDASEIGQYFIK